MITRRSLFALVLGLTLPFFASAATSGAVIGTYSVGSYPSSTAFDPSTNSIWVANYGSNTVTKLNATTGALVGTYATAGGSNPLSVAFDSSTNSIWVVNVSSNNVNKFSTATGALIGTYTTGTTPHGVAFDSFTNSIWITNYASNNVKKFNAVTGALIGTYATGSGPDGVAFDSFTNSIWIANSGSNNITKLSASTGALIGTYGVGSFPSSIAFDPSTNSVWVANVMTSNMSKLNAATGGLVGTYSVGNTPTSIVFDSSTNSIWVTNGVSNNIMKFNAASGSVLGTYAIGSDPGGLSFDSSTNSIWVANYLLNNVMKIGTGASLPPTASIIIPTAGISVPQNQAVAFSGTGIASVIPGGCPVSGAFSVNSPGGVPIYDLTFGCSGSTPMITLRSKDPSCVGAGQCYLYTTFTPGVTTDNAGYLTYYNWGIGSSFAGLVLVHYDGATKKVTVADDASLANAGIPGGWYGPYTMSPGNTIVSYEWREGNCTTGTLLSTLSSFSTSTLSVSTHTIYLRVKDSLGTWSTNCPSRIVTVTSANTPPLAPTISGPTTTSINTAQTYSFTTTDPDSDQIRYGIDWNMDGTADEWLPTGTTYVNSGTSQSTAHSWSTSGTKTFQALAQDTPGANSSWATYSVTVLTAVPTVTLSASPSSINSGQSSMLSWTSTNATSCTGIGFSPGGTTSGSVSTGPLTQDSPYQVTCSGPGGTSAPANATVTVAIPNFSITAAPTRVQTGSTSTITWSATGVTACTVSGPGVSNSAKTGTATPTITYQSTYTLTCDGTSQKVTVNIVPVYNQF